MANVRVARPRLKIRPVSAGGDGLYHAGYPADGFAEANVSALWLFDEASGDIVDEVAGLTIPDVGSPTYNVACSGLFAPLTPGITANGATSYFLSTSPASACALGVTDFTIEYWFKSTSGNNNAYVFSTLAGVEQRGWGAYINFGTAPQRLKMFMRGSDDTSLDISIAVSTIVLNDGNEHKVRIVGDRDGNMSIYLDGILQGSSDMTGMVASSIPADKVGVFIIAQDEANGLPGTLFNFRISKNATNNSGGPSGG